jgi:tRNA-modifying protein YgfZ
VTGPATSIDPRLDPIACAVPWGLVRVHGPDAEPYLQGQLSQDVQLDVGATSWTFLLQPTGKVDAWLRMTRQADDDYLLDAPFLDTAPVVGRLERFKLRTRVEIEALDRGVRSHRGLGAGERAAAEAGPGALVLPAGWPGVDGADVIAAVDSGDAAVGPPAVEELEPWQALRIECGVPLNGSELTASTIPAEVGSWAVAASVSFTKGCYTGQELVARIDSRGGNVPRPIRALVVEGDEVPPTGTTVVSGDREVGTLTSVAVSATNGTVALAPIARTVEAGEKVELRWDRGSAAASVATPPLR